MYSTFQVFLCRYLFVLECTSLLHRPNTNCTTSFKTLLTTNRVQIINIFFKIEAIKLKMVEGKLDLFEISCFIGVNEINTQLHLKKLDTKGWPLWLFHLSFLLPSIGNELIFLSQNNKNKIKSIRLFRQVEWGCLLKSKVGWESFVGKGVPIQLPPGGDCPSDGFGFVMLEKMTKITNHNGILF